ncbi:hypothetical protein [Georgenia sp. Marseille-Q6866]
MTSVHEGTAAGWTATSHDIGFTGRMSHLVSAASWSGVVDGDGGGLATVARAASTGLPAAGTSTTTAAGGATGGPLTRATAAPGVPVVHFAPSPGPLAPPPPADRTPVQRREETAAPDAAGQPPVAWTNPDLQLDDGTVVEIPLSPGRPLDPPPVQRSTGGRLRPGPVTARVVQDRRCSGASRAAWVSAPRSAPPRPARPAAVRGGRAGEPRHA